MTNGGPRNGSFRPVRTDDLLAGLDRHGWEQERFTTLWSTVHDSEMGRSLKLQLAGRERFPWPWAGSTFLFATKFRDMAHVIHVTVNNDYSVNWIDAG